jgi:tRNA G18 (ribose-2'-O)-methylase SpoU
MLQCTLILHNIRSVHNVGSIFRTADAAGVSEILLVGITPAPVDRFGRIRPDFAKVSLGAEHAVPWKQVPELGTVIAHLKSEGYLILALEQHIRSVQLFDYLLPKDAKVALILGSEPSGLAQDDLHLVDDILEIPMYGRKESLNVSVAAGIALYALFRPTP